MFVEMCERGRETNASPQSPIFGFRPLSSVQVQKGTCHQSRHTVSSGTDPSRDEVLGDRNRKSTRQGTTQRRSLGSWNGDRDRKSNPSSNTVYEKITVLYPVLTPTPPLSFCRPSKHVLRGVHPLATSTCTQVWCIKSSHRT